MTKQCVVLFPGQGSQKAGMLLDQQNAYPVIREVYEEASDALGYDLSAVIQDEQKLSLTEFTQPAILAASVAMWRIWEPLTDFEIAGMAGHSLGEYTALVCAGAMTLSEGVKLVSARGSCMQRAVPEGVGAMLAVLGLDDEVLRGVCASVSTAQYQLTPANYNAPGQIVVAGHQALVSAFTDAATQAGARRIIALPMSVPSHCALMAPAAEAFSEALAQVAWAMPKVQILQNATLESPKSISAMVAALTRQLCEPVPWVKIINKFISEGVEEFVECGPGQVLCGLIKRIDREANTLPVEKWLQEEASE
jgi:[acyl-carrier-protein] S-malonyltransferase